MDLTKLIVTGQEIITRPTRHKYIIKKHKVFTGFHRRLLGHKKTYLWSHGNTDLLYALMLYFVQHYFKECKPIKVVNIVTEPSGFRLDIKVEFNKKKDYMLIVMFTFKGSYSYLFKGFLTEPNTVTIIPYTIISWECTEPDGLAIEWIDLNEENG